MSLADIEASNSACSAVLACADFVFNHQAPAQDDMDHYIYQGGIVYQHWLSSRPENTGYATANSMIQLLTDAVPIVSGQEFGGFLWREQEATDVHPSLPQALQQLDPQDAAVLTCGGYSMAILGSRILFDSHPCPQTNQKAVCHQFASHNDLIQHLRQRFTDASMPYALCQVALRDYQAPTVFPTQAQAFKHARQSPRGLKHVWPRDLPSGTGAKEYAVSGVEDFCHYYVSLKPEQRVYYELIPEAQPVSFFVDAEFERFPENVGVADEMVRALIQLVREQWAFENSTTIELPLDRFVILDSSSTSQFSLENDDDDDDIALSMSLNSSLEDAIMLEEEKQHDHVVDLDNYSTSDSSSGDEYSNVETEESCEPIMEKVSFHIHNRDMWFRNIQACGAFLKRVEQRAQRTPRLCRLLSVWRKKRQEMQMEFFADQGVYTRNRCLRLVYSTKMGKRRYLLPYKDEGNGDSLHITTILSTLVTYRPPAASCLAPPPSCPPLVNACPPLVNTCPPSLLSVYKWVEKEYEPEQMRGVQLSDTGLITFSMINHNCQICNDTHNNQTYVVCDLKRRVAYQKCHVDRSRTGPEITFPRTLRVSIVDVSELRPGNQSSTRILPANSHSAMTVLQFGRAIYSSARTAPHIPEPGTVPVLLDTTTREYRVNLPGQCPRDSGATTLVISQSKLTIRCNGNTCSTKGYRWHRPSHSARHDLWNLSFLFPEATSIRYTTMTNDDEVVSGVFPEACCGSPEAFLEENNFLMCLGITNYTHGATSDLYKDRLNQVAQWCKSVEEEALPEERDSSGVHQLSHLVLSKVGVIEAILLSKPMEVCYRECLSIAPDFVYPVTLIPHGPKVLVIALFVYLTGALGYKRVEDEFYVPVTDDQGHVYYQVKSIEDLLTSVCPFDKTPNLCASVMWNGRIADDLRKVLTDNNHFPSQRVSKRFLGYKNIVYDLEDNVALTWDEVKKMDNAIPFNYLDREFPVDQLQLAKERCPQVHVVQHDGGERRVEFTFPDNEHSGIDFVPTPLFDGPLLDQQFTSAMILWLYALLGRMFHDIGKSSGDNWEIVLFLIGTPGSFKSSIIAILKSYLQPNQFGVIPTRVEERFPIASLLGKLMIFMSECGGCTLEADLFKLMASGDPITVNVKHRTGTTIPEWNIPCLFAGNTYMEGADTNGSQQRRSGVWPFAFLLRQGHGITDLVQQIIQTEAELLLIKLNTLYLAMRTTIKERIQPLLPSRVQDATQHAIIESDSLRSFFATKCVVTGDRQDRLKWAEVWEAYKEWCRKTGRRHYHADPHSIDVQTMLRRLGVRLSRSRKSPTTLVGIRARNTSKDAPYESPFRIRMVHRENDGAAEQQNDEDSSNLDD